jgi:hypothetical protein
MKNKFMTTAAVILGIVALGGMAVTAANTVSTTPPPATVSRFENTATHDANRGADDPATHDVADDRSAATTPSTTAATTPRAATTPTTVDDRGGSGPAATTVTTVDDRGGVNRSTATTIDDHRGGTTNTSIDDHGGRSGSGSGSGGHGSDG